MSLASYTAKHSSFGQKLDHNGSNLISIIQEPIWDFNLENCKMKSPHTCISTPSQYPNFALSIHDFGVMKVAWNLLVMVSLIFKFIPQLLLRLVLMLGATLWTTCQQLGIIPMNFFLFLFNFLMFKLNQLGGNMLLCVRIWFS